MSNPDDFLPFGKRVLLKRLEAESTYHGIIHLPEKAIDKPQICTIVGYGAEAKSDVPELEIGDQVLIGKYSGTEIKIADENLLIVKAEDILGKV